MRIISVQPGEPEKTKFWRDPVFANLEVLQATYVTHAFTRHTHPGYAIGVIERGAEYFDYGRGKYCAFAGNSVIINPDEPHTGSAATENGWSYRMFYPEIEILQSLASEIAGREQAVPFFLQPVINDEQLGASIAQLHRVLEKSTSIIERQSHMLATLSYLITRYADKRPKPGSIGREAEAVRLVKEYLHEQYNQNISLEDLAKAANLSQFHLVRVFQKATGLPPHSYLTQLRINRAKKLLESPLSLSQIAIDTGFTDQSHFTRYFKRTVGVSPGQYRAQR